MSCKAKSTIRRLPSQQEYLLVQQSLFLFHTCLGAEVDGSAGVRVVVEEFSSIGSFTASITPSGPLVSCIRATVGQVHRQVVVRLVDGRHLEGN